MTIANTINFERLQEMEDRARAATVSPLGPDVVALVAEIRRCREDVEAKEEWVQAVKIEIKKMEDKMSRISEMEREHKQLRELAETSHINRMLAKRLQRELLNQDKELDEARAAAVQWVTYDGTAETLPPNGSTLLLHYERRHGEDSLVYNHVGTIDNDRSCWVILGNVMYISAGDRWAYLPQPPEVK